MLKGLNNTKFIVEWNLADSKGLESKEILLHLMQEPRVEL